MEEQQRSFYAIIPANVRYDTELTPNAKLLYAEITALSNETGYCWATNEYFMRLFEAGKSTIINWVNQLVAKGYLEREIIYKEGTKEIQSRYLRLVATPSPKNWTTPSIENCTTPSPKNWTENNINKNNINYYNNIYSAVVDYLNEKAGTHYKATTNSTQRHIRARLNEKYTLDDFKTVIDKKVAEWKGTDFEQYLRPETLFGNKFENYLNANNKTTFIKSKQKEDMYEQLDRIFGEMENERID